MIIEGIVDAQEDTGRDYILENNGYFTSMRQVFQKLDRKHVRITIENIEDTICNNKNK